MEDFRFIVEVTQAVHFCKQVHIRNILSKEAISVITYVITYCQDLKCIPYYRGRLNICWTFSRACTTQPLIGPSRLCRELFGSIRPWPGLINSLG